MRMISQLFQKTPLTIFLPDSMSTPTRPSSSAVAANAVVRGDVCVGAKADADAIKRAEAITVFMVYVSREK
jgi:hypothetical protein